MGEAAREWVRFLASAGQRCWQILPLGPTGWGDSPYQSFSAFALSPYYVDIDTLVSEGLLTRAEAEAPTWGRSVQAVDYGALYRKREPLLRKAFARWNPGAAFDAFRARNAHWLRDYCLYTAIKVSEGGRPWQAWAAPLRLRDAITLNAFEAAHGAELRFHAFVQYQAFSQWERLRAYAAERHIIIIGDMPIYAALDSADVWSRPSLFQLDDERRPLRVAGCPPDAFARDGQLWGNPLYDWDACAAEGFDWWLSRLRTALALFDVVRIDHFKGIESYFSIAADAPTARDGRWVKGPGLAFVDALKRAFPEGRLIAEDLGCQTPELRALLAASGFPGMKVLQFAFDSREESEYMPYAYERNSVVYTGTHDNSTCRGWFKAAPSEDAQMARDFFGIKDDRDGPAAFIRMALASPSDTCIIPMQDWLALDDRARINTPSTLGRNWRWRLSPAAASPTLAARMRRLCAVTGRGGSSQ
jgi:4-alpha-glucanotransferase